MSKVTDPGEKKRLSLELDRRNTYGENAKASRKSIPAAKARGHRAERRAVAEVLAHGHASGPEDAVLAVEASAKSRAKAKKLGSFRKDPDQPLSVVLKRTHRSQKI